MNSKAVFIYGFAKGLNLPYTMRAVNLAHILHKDQKRKDGVDYVEHVIATGHLLIAHGVKNDAVLAASILHDAIEDTDYTYEKMDEEFNSDVTNLVRLLSKEDGVSIELYFKKMSEDVRALAVKAADRTHNISDMANAFSIEKMEEYVEETEKYILPQMKIARKMNIEYGDLFVALSAHINAVILVVKKLIKLSRENN